MTQNVLNSFCKDLGIIVTGPYHYQTPMTAAKHLSATFRPVLAFRSVHASVHHTFLLCAAHTQLLYPVFYQVNLYSNWPICLVNRSHFRPFLKAKRKDNKNTTINTLIVLLGSGPEGVDDLCFHTYGELSPPASSPPPLSGRPPLPDSNSSLEAQIPVSRSKSLP